MRLLGIDPGLRATGWGIVEADGNRLRHIADGVVRPARDETSMAMRLAAIHHGLRRVIEDHLPVEAAVEEVFVNRNPASALKLGQARGVALLVPALFGLPVTEYPANLVKKSVVGVGHGDKAQVIHMVRVLLPGCLVAAADAADALAVAICHAHLRATALHWRVAEAAR